ncbi:collagen alpha-1(III) chain-like isoform X1 [Haemorhous mexicanus]|uniref:collagen alpha-1(III) chain-like isoform X1 n=1 Tax=Haemorhous mexicanus TaxID=30427 RepID=UPI0028BD7DD4|nr:collagen alpha-1(III) chain-like isoform X1 [Haemorhous mexicanus]
MAEEAAGAAGSPGPAAAPSPRGSTGPQEDERCPGGASSESGGAAPDPNSEANFNPPSSKGTPGSSSRKKRAPSSPGQEPNSLRLSPAVTSPQDPNSEANFNPPSSKGTPGSSSRKKRAPSSPGQEPNSLRLSPAVASPRGRRRSWRRSSLQGRRSRRKSLPPVHREVTELSQSISLELPEVQRLSLLLLSSFQFSARQLQQELQGSPGFQPDAFSAQEGPGGVPEAPAEAAPGWDPRELPGAKGWGFPGSSPGGIRGAGEAAQGQSLRGAPGLGSAPAAAPAALPGGLQGSGAAPCRDPALGPAPSWPRPLPRPRPRPPARLRRCPGPAGPGPAAAAAPGGRGPTSREDGAGIPPAEQELPQGPLGAAGFQSVPEASELPRAAAAAEEVPEGSARGGGMKIKTPKIFRGQGGDGNIWMGTWTPGRRTPQHLDGDRETWGETPPNIWMGTWTPGRRRPPTSGWGPGHLGGDPPPTSGWGPGHLGGDNPNIWMGTWTPGRRHPPQTSGWGPGRRPPQHLDGDLDTWGETPPQHLDGDRDTWEETPQHLDGDLDTWEENPPTSGWGPAHLGGDPHPTSGWGPGHLGGDPPQHLDGDLDTWEETAPTSGWGPGHLGGDPPNIWMGTPTAGMGTARPGWGL